jgi:hypothetical protein
VPQIVEAEVLDAGALLRQSPGGGALMNAFSGEGEAPARVLSPRGFQRCHGVRDSDLLRSESIPGPTSAGSGNNGAGKPMLVRLTVEDRLLLDARAEARGIRPATYASVLLRSHLRQLAPLPKDELLALKRSIAELGSIGRNINQIARAVSGGGEVPGSVRGEFRAMLKICLALRDNTKTLLKANLVSWAAGCTRGDQW